MKKLSVRAFVLLSVAAALTACGGDDDDVFDNNDPTPTALSASVAVSSATQASLNGVYSSTTIALNEVRKVNPIGGDPETCRFRFSGLRQAGSSQLMDGDIRYIPGNPEIRVAFVSISGVEFRLQGSANAAADRANNEIDFNGATLTSTQGTGATIVLTGSIPMRSPRPEGC